MVNTPNKAVLSSEISNALRLASYWLRVAYMMAADPLLDGLFLSDQYEILCIIGTPNLIVDKIPANNT